jgi:hypothetical protein
MSKQLRAKLKCILRLTERRRQEKFVNNRQVSVATQEIISNAECDPLVEQMAPAIDAALAFIIGTMLKRRQQNME